MRRLRSFQESRKWYEQTMNIDNFEGRSVALGGEVWRTGARAGLGGIAGHDLGHVSSPWVVPRSELLTLPGAVRPCYAHSKRTFQGPSRSLLGARFSRFPRFFSGGFEP